MIKLVGETLQQYDLNRQVEIIPTGTVLEVKFLNRSPNAFEVAFTEENGRVYADIPNMLLKSFGVITCETLELIEDGSQIEQRMTFTVERRKKPEGYGCPADTILTPNHIFKNANLPFGEKTVMGDTLTWDGNTVGLEWVAFDEEVTYYKVSDKIPTIDDFANGSVRTIFKGNTSILKDDNVRVLVDGVLVDEDGLCIVIAENAVGVEVNGIMFPASGIYFSKNEDSNRYTSSLTINGYNGFPTTEITPLPNKYLDIVETVGSDTLKWDGNTEGLEVGTAYDSIEDITFETYRISEATPELDMLALGGVVRLESGSMSWSDDSFFWAIVDNIYSLNGVAFIVYEDNVDAVDDGISYQFPKKGIYVYGHEIDVPELKVTSLTINGYTGFPKEQVKQEYLPSGGGLCIVELVDGGFTPTFAEVEKAFYDGRNIVFRRSDGAMYRMQTVVSNEAGLEQIAFDSGCTIFPNGGVYDE